MKSWEELLFSDRPCRTSSEAGNERLMSDIAHAIPYGYNAFPNRHRGRGNKERGGQQDKSICAPDRSPRGASGSARDCTRYECIDTIGRLFFSRF
jgi:hypothetical protein